MMRTPSYLDTHSDALVTIWHTGWDMALHRTLIGVFFRLEKGVLFRGGLRTGWWWRPTTSSAMKKLLCEARAYPRRQPFSPTTDAEWEEN